MKKDFYYTFQISRKIIFTVEYNRNYFSTSAAEFNRPKTDFVQCGQAQDDLLTGKAMSFYEKWDHLHLKDLDEKQYSEVTQDIEGLKDAYNFLETEKYAGFHEEKELSKMPVKKASKI